MQNSYTRDGTFNQHLTTIKDFYNLFKKRNKLESLQDKIN